MKSAGWIVAAIVIIAAGAFYFYPQMIKAPSQEGTATTTPQVGTQQTSNPDIPGTWRSNSDAKFTREIRTGGVIIDRYEGEPTAGLNGSWKSVVAADLPASIPAASFADKTIIEVVWEGGIETTYFVVSDLSATSMTTTDLTGRGEVTVYTRI